MIILSDTDVVHKLACCEMLLEFLQYLKCPPNEVWVLPALPHMLRRKLARSPTGLKNVEDFMNRVRKIPAARLETLDRFTSLDVGEQQLLAILCDDARVDHLVTGDKRALDKIAALTYGDAQLLHRMNETSVYCFEAIMLGLIQNRGFGIVQARIHHKWTKLEGQPVDEVISKAFPETGTVEHAVNVLEEHLAQLKARLPPLQFETPLSKSLAPAPASAH